MVLGSDNVGEEGCWHRCGGQEGDKEKKELVIFAGGLVVQFRGIDSYDLWIGA